MRSAIRLKRRAVVKRRNHHHPGGIILDCRHWRPYYTGAKVNDKRYCRRCSELHAVMFVVEPKVTKLVEDSGQLTIDDIPPF